MPLRPLHTALLRRLFAGLLLLLTLPTGAAPLERSQVPDPLKPWVDWVLQDQKDLDCPWNYNGAERQCSWPATLELQLNQRGGSFRQQWQVFGETRVQLPGNSERWPQNVRDDTNTPLLVQSRDGLPQVVLKPGLHVIQGEFAWDKLPRTLTVTPAAGLVNLHVNGQRVEHPVFNQQGELWLTESESTEVTEDNLEVQVFRKLTDSHPFEVETMIRLRVSGKQRNAVLGPVLLQDMLPWQIDSPLPVRMAGKDSMQVQLRPGEWTVSVRARAIGDQTQFVLPESREPWPQQEVWVFATDPEVRQVEVAGVTAVDPNQTLLPEAWKSLPAYLLSAGESLKLDVVRRGAVIEGSNELSLKRRVWLDFDGGGYTLKDQLNGQLQQQSRLGVIADLQLGRVSIDGQPQFITQDAGQGNAGVEIRNSTVNLEAESRYEQGRSILPVSGWQQDLQSVETTLYLPPGWLLFSASGTDNIPGSWLMDWSLLDLFLVLITALAVGYLYGWPWSVFTLLALALVWHEEAAPRLVWLNLLAALALWRAMPAGRLRRWLGYYRWLSVLLVVLVLLPYMIHTVRIGLYPQLESGFSMDVGQSMAMGAAAPSAPMEAPEAEMVMQEEAGMNQAADAVQDYSSAVRKAMPRPAPLPAMPKVRSVYGSKIDLKAIDPNSIVQTGPGLPDWQSWHAVDLSWGGPVKADETSRLWLIGPRLNLLFKLLGIVLLLGLLWRLLAVNGSDESGTGAGRRQRYLQLPDWKTVRQGFSALAVMLVLPVLLLPSPQVRAADLPDQALLEELKQRLLRAPECQPDCAQLDQMQVMLANNRLNLLIRAQAVMDTAIPLPGQQDSWMPQQVLLDGEPVTALRRDDSQTLWVLLPQGQHALQLAGDLPARNAVPLSLPLKPHAVSWQSQDKNWTLEGVREDGIAESQLQLNRVQSEDAATRLEQQSILPTFVRIERNLDLGLEWQVRNTVTRLSPSDLPVTLNIPLLPGEQPLGEQQQIINQQIRITLAAGEQSAFWSSRLPVGERLELKANASPEFVERWSAGVSPVWHMEPEGIPVNRFQRGDSGQSIPEWFPWPGETLVLNMSRPQGLPGQTVTIRNSLLAVSSGKRASDVSLEMAILSSRGVRHDLQLPASAEVQSLQINGVRQQLQNVDNRLTLNLQPGEQQVVLEWREPEPLGTVYRFPAVDTGLPSVNARARITPAQDRWILWVNGPDLGPAVLFWGVLLVLAVLSFLLGRSGLTPLKSWQWLLLAVGLSQTETTLMILVAGWLLILHWRGRQELKQLREWQFNALQLLLAGLTLVALLVLVSSVANGLLGQPDMQIEGNDSSAYQLNWYQDRSAQVLPQPVLVSVPMWIYRLLMLAWALWLAYSVLGWLRDGWKALNTGGLWRSLPPRVKKAG